VKRGILALFTLFFSVPLEAARIGGEVGLWWGGDAGYVSYTLVGPNFNITMEAFVAVGMNWDVLCLYDPWHLSGGCQKGETRRVVVDPMGPFYSASGTVNGTFYPELTISENDVPPDVASFGDPLKFSFEGPSFITDSRSYALPFALRGTILVWNENELLLGEFQGLNETGERIWAPISVEGSGTVRFRLRETGLADGPTLMLDDSSFFDNHAIFDLAEVPEPGTMMPVGIVLIGCLVRRMRSARTAMQTDRNDHPSRAHRSAGVSGRNHCERRRIYSGGGVR
jgi:hypothetical protein